MARKPQQHTLSVRISETLRDYLERAREVISSSRGEPVSTSDVAKTLLELAKGERLEDRLEVAELLRHPTETLLAVRQKWEQKRLVSRTELIVLSHYVQVGCEGSFDDLELPPKDSFANLLEAFLAVLALRVPGKRLHDHYYLGNLGPLATAESKELPESELVSESVKGWIRGLRESGSTTRPVFAGRNLAVALRDENLEDIAAVNSALADYLPALYRLAARGHWLKEQRPIRLRRIEKDYGVRSSLFPQVTAGDFRLTILPTDEEDLSMALEMQSRDVTYPLGPYPQIREFATMLERLQPAGQWKGREFFGYSNRFVAAEVPHFYFRHRSNGIAFGFTVQAWESLKELFARALGLPELQPVLRELALQYGEV